MVSLFKKRRSSIDNNESKVASLPLLGKCPDYQYFLWLLFALLATHPVQKGVLPRRVPLLSYLANKFNVGRLEKVFPVFVAAFSFAESFQSFQLFGWEMACVSLYLNHHSTYAGKLKGLQVVVHLFILSLAGYATNPRFGVRRLWSHSEGEGRRENLSWVIG